VTAPARTRRKAAENTKSTSKASAKTTVKTAKTAKPTGKTAAPSKETQAPERRQGARRTSAAERAYARRAQRVEGRRRPAERPEKVRRFRVLPRSRASFVLTVMVLLAAGVATTLWLSTQAIADSYRLEQLREENSNLAEQSELLQQDVATADSPSSLAARAKALGMVPAGEPAHLVQNPDGSITVVGTPEKVTPPPPPPPPSTPAPPPAPAANGATPGMPVEGDAPQADPQQADTSQNPQSAQTTQTAQTPPAGTSGPGAGR